MTDHQTLRLESIARELNNWLAGMPLRHYPYFDGRDNVIKVSSEEDHNRQRKYLIDAVNVVLSAAGTLECPAQN